MEFIGHSPAFLCRWSQQALGKLGEGSPISKENLNIRRNLAVLFAHLVCHSIL